MTANQISEQTYRIHSIGTIRREEENITIDILPTYRPALDKLDLFSHVIVFWWAHKLSDPKNRERLQTELPYAPGVTAGVYATRAPHRPNPIAMTTCKLLDMDAGCWMPDGGLSLDMG